MTHLIALCMRLKSAVQAPAAAAFWLFIVVAMAAVPPDVLAQPPVAGRIHGAVTDTEGQPLPGTTVTVRATELSLERTTTTGSQGTYTLLGLPPGPYEITIENSPWTPQVLRVTLGANGNVPVDATLVLGAVVSDEITVTSDTTTAIETDKLPLVDRSPFAAAGTLAPGVQTGSAPGQLRMSGGFAYDNLFLVNGADVSDNLFGHPLPLITEDAVQEFQIITSGLSAEYGRSSGAIVNIATREGTNDFHGSFRYDLSSQELTAAQRIEELEGRELRPSENIFQGTLGGPILRDRIWFFGTYRGSALDQNRQLGALGPTADPITASSGVDERRYEGKLTASPFEGHRLVGSYIDVEREEDGLPSLGMASATPGTRLTPTTASDLAVVRYSGLARESLFAEAQYSYRTFSILNGGNVSRDRLDSPLLTLNGALHVANQARNGLVDEERDADEIRASLTYFVDRLAGSHTFKGGIARLDQSRSGNSALSSTGFAALTEYERDAAGNITLDGSGAPTPIFVPGLSRGIFYPSLGASEVTATTTSLYVSDEVRFDSRLTVNAGVRYDRGRVEAGGETTVESGVFQPRVDLTFSAARDLALSAFYGTYAGRYDVKQFSGGVLDPVSNFQVYTGPIGRGLRFAPGFDPANYATIGLANPSLTTRVDPEATPPVVREFSLRADATVLRGRFSISYVDRSFDTVIESLVPAGPPVTITSGGVSTRSDTTVVGNTKDLERRYRALLAKVLYFPASRWHLGGNYTGEITNEGNYFGETPGGSPDVSVIGNYPAIFNADRHYEVADFTGMSQPHRFRAWTIVTQPVRGGALDIGGVFAFDSGRSYLHQAVVPRTPAQTAIAVGEGYVNPPASQTISFNGQGGRFEAAHRLDLSVTYTVDLPRGIEAWVKGDLFNVYNQQSKIAFDISGAAGGPADPLGLPTTFTPSPTFGRARTIFDLQSPREFRLAMGLRF